MKKQKNQKIVLINSNVTNNFKKKRIKYYNCID